MCEIWHHRREANEYQNLDILFNEAKKADTLEKKLAFTGALYHIISKHGLEKGWLGEILTLLQGLRDLVVLLEELDFVEVDEVVAGFAEDFEGNLLRCNRRWQDDDRGNTFRDCFYDQALAAFGCH